MGNQKERLKTSRQKGKSNEVVSKTDALKNKSQATVEKNIEKIDYLKDKEQKTKRLIEYIRSDKKIDALKERGEIILDPKDLAAIEIKDKKIMKEVRLLLMLIEKYLPGNGGDGIKLSSELYQEACTRDSKGKFKSIDLDVLRERFIGWPSSDERGEKEDEFININGYSATQELGFYYMPEPKYYIDDDGIDERECMPAGWYTWDQNPSSYNEWHGIFLSQNLHRVNETPEIWPESASARRDSVTTKLSYRYNDGDGIINEIGGKRGTGGTDSGLDTDRATELTKDIKEIDKQNSEIARKGLAEKKYQETIFKGFKKGFENFAVPSIKVKTSKDAKRTKKGAAKFSLMSSLNMLFGGKALYFQYRYMPEHNRVYCLSFDKSENPDAYIEMNNNTGRVGEWIEYNGEGKIKGKSLGEDLYDGMEVAKFEKEYLLVNVKNTKVTDITKNDQLESTKDMLLTLPTNKKNKSFPYDKLEGRLKDLEKELMQKLNKKFPNDNNKVKTLAEIRIKDIRKKVRAKIDGDETLKVALEKKPNFRMKMSINSGGTVNVEIAEKPKFLKDIKKQLKKDSDLGIEAVGSFEDRLNAAIDAKYPGFMGAIIKWFIGEEGLKKKSFITTAILSYLGIKGFGSVKSGFLSRKVNQEFFDKLLRKKDKEKKMKKKLIFDKPVKLTGKKIIIPKGKGLKLGGALKIELKGAGIVLAGPLKEKKKVKFRNPFAKGKSQYQYKEYEIIIHPGSGSGLKKETVIPEGTEIPRGAKIVRI